MDEEVGTIRVVDISLLLSRNQRIVSWKDKPQNEKEVARFCLLYKIAIKLLSLLRLWLSSETCL